MDIFHHIRDYGAWIYLIIILWTFCEGETCVILAGVAASKGYLDLPAVILSAWTGATSGDFTVFMVSRKYGKRLLLRFPRLVPGVNRAVRLLERFSVAFILSFRFIYGVRNGAAIAVGLSGIPARRFAALNFVSAGLWAATFTLVGYLGGSAHTAMADGVSATASMAALAFMVAVALFFVGLHHVRHRLRDARLKRAVLLAAAVLPCVFEAPGEGNASLKSPDLAVTLEPTGAADAAPPAGEPQ